LKLLDAKNSYNGYGTCTDTVYAAHGAMRIMERAIAAVSEIPAMQDKNKTDKQQMTQHGRAGKKKNSSFISN